ncbi:MAG: TNT domain-containing protein [Actinomycetota bacterium]
MRRLRHSLAVLGAVLCLATVPVPAAAGTAAAVVACSIPLDGDPRLGPSDLPTTGPVAIMVSNWRRFGDLSSAEFLHRYWDAAANDGRGSYIFPPDDGYYRAVMVAGSLPVGTQVDRFGSEFGSFLAPRLTRYQQRAIPPQSLNTFDPAYPCNYHTYRVAKRLPVRLGPIAPWFEQMGLGLQYQLDASLLPGAPAPLSVLWLVDNGYLDRTN